MKIETLDSSFSHVSSTSESILVPAGAVVQLERSVNLGLLQVFGTLEVATGVNVATQCLENQGQIVFTDANAVLSAREIKGSGAILSEGDLCVSSDTDLTINLKDGRIAVSGSLRFSSFGTLTVLNGDYHAERAYFTAENISRIRANRIDAPIEIEAFESFIGVEHGDLLIERHCVEGDPIFYNRTGDLTFPAIATGGEDFIALAAGSIVGGGVDAGGGRIVIAAGVSFDVTDDDNNPDDGHIDCADCSGKYTISGPGTPGAGIGIAGSLVSSASVIITCTGIAAVNGSVVGASVSTTTAGVVPTGIVVGGDVVANVGQAELYTSGGILLQSNNVSGKTGVTTVYQNGAVLPAFITMNAVDSIDGEVNLVTEGELNLTALVQAKQGIKTYLQNGGTVQKPSKITAKNFFSSNGAVELITTGELAVSDSIDAKQKISTVLDTGADFLCPSKIDTKQLSSQESFIELITSGDLKVDGTVTCNQGYFNTYKSRGALKKRPTKIEITGTVKTSGNNVVLVSSGNIKTVDIDVSTTSPQHVGAGISILSYEGVGVGGGSTQFVIGGNANANGVNGNIKMDTTTGGGASASEFFLFLHVKNEGNGGIKLQRRNAISVAASQSKAGAVVFDCKGGNVDLPTSEGTFAVNGAAGQSAGYIVVNAKKLLANGTSLSANDSGSGLQHGILISANEINHGATAFKLTANGTGGPAGTDNVNYVYLLPENTISISDTLDANNLRIFVTLPPAKDVTPGPMAIKGTGAVTVQANGTGSAVVVSGYPMTFEGQTQVIVNGAQTVAAVSYRGPAGAEAGINLSGASLDITANGTNGANGGSILLKTSTIATAVGTPVNLTANASGTAGQGGFIGVEMTGLDETAWVLNALVLGGTASGKGGNINLVVPNLKSSGTLNASSRGQGNGGNITFNGKRLFVEGTNAKVLADSEKGNAGGISIGGAGELDELKTTGGRVSAVARNEDAQFTGLGGVIEVKAKSASFQNSVFINDGARGSLLQDIQISQAFDSTNAEFSASAGTSGAATFASGGILKLQSKGTFTFTGSKATANAKGNSGNGGKVTISAGTSSTHDLNIGVGSTIAANAGSQSGAAQTVSLTSGGSVFISEQSKIDCLNSVSQFAPFDNIEVSAGQDLDLASTSDINASARAGTNGSGGKVKISAKDARINGRLLSNADGSGTAGKATVDVVNLKTTNCQIRTDSKSENRGQIRLLASGNIEIKEQSKISALSVGSTQASEPTIMAASNGTFIVEPTAEIDASCTPSVGGNGGKIELSAISSKIGGTVKADAGTNGVGGSIRIVVTEDHLVEGVAKYLSRGGTSFGDGGNIFVSAGGTSTYSADTLMDASADKASGTTGEGTGGQIRLSAKRIAVPVNGALVRANGSANGTGGIIDFLETDEANTNSVLSLGLGFRVEALGGIAGSGGALTAESAGNNIELRGNGIFVTSRLEGNGGSISVKALKGSITALQAIDASARGNKDGGIIELEALTLISQNNTELNCDAHDVGDGPSKAGTIKITTQSTQEQELRGNIHASAEGADAGRITVKTASSLVVRQNTIVSAKTFANGESGEILLSAGNSAQGGDIALFGLIDGSSENTAQGGLLKLSYAGSGRILFAAPAVVDMFVDGLFLTRRGIVCENRTIDNPLRIILNSNFVNADRQAILLDANLQPVSLTGDCETLKGLLEVRNAQTGEVRTNTLLDKLVLGDFDVVDTLVIRSFADIISEPNQSSTIKADSLDVQSLESPIGTQDAPLRVRVSSLRAIADGVGSQSVFIRNDSSEVEVRSGSRSSGSFTFVNQPLFAVSNLILGTITAGKNEVGDIEGGFVSVFSLQNIQVKANAQITAFGGNVDIQTATAASTISIGRRAEIAAVSKNVDDLSTGNLFISTGPAASPTSCNCTGNVDCSLSSPPPICGPGGITAAADPSGVKNALLAIERSLTVYSELSDHLFLNGAVKLNALKQLL